MFNLAAFSLRAVTECTAQLRNIGLRAANTVDVGSRIAHYLYRHLGDAKAGKLHCALVRVFITTSYGHLDVESQRLAQEALGRNPSSTAMKCLTLIGTAGEREEWNNRAQSRRFRVIPLASEGFVAQFPMFSQLFQQLGVKLQSPVPSESDLLLDWEEKTYNVFYVRDAVGSCFVPVQRQFVIPYEIKSVLGFGGVLPSKELFAVILFSKVRIPHHTADMFKTLALGTKLALLPFDTRRTPSIPSSRGAAITATPRASTEGTRKLRSRIETLEHLLEVHEETTREQSGTLEQAIEELKNKSQTLERREAAIQEQTNRLQSIMASMGEGVLLLNRQGHLLLMNPAAEQMLGLTAQTDVAARLKDIDGLHEKLVAPALNGEEIGHVEVCLQPLGYQQGAWLSVSARPIRDNAGRLEGSVMVFRDVTWRKRSQELLREREVRYRRLVETSPDAILINKADRIVFMNSAGLRLFGATTPEQVVGKTMLELFHSECHALINAHLHRLRMFHEPAPLVEEKIIRLDGSIVDVEVAATPFSDIGETAIQLLVRDISERKRGEAERQQLLNHRLLLLESTGEGMYGIDLDGRCTFINKAALAMFGYHPDEVQGKTMHALVHHSHQDGLPYPSEECKILAAFRKGEGCHGDDEVMWRKDGTSFSVRYSSFPIMDGGVIKGAVVAVTDITERKRADTALKASEQQFASFMDNLPGFAWIKDAQGRLLYLNRLFQGTLLREVDWKGKTAFDLWPAEFAAQYESNDRKVLAAKAPLQGVESYMQDGEVRHSLVSKFPIFDRENTAMLIGGMAVDITESRQAEEKLRRLNRLIELSYEPILVWDFENGIVEWNQGCEQLYGYRRTEALGQNSYRLLKTV
ncbi:MAG: PAS domain S-box protein, partial [Nitrospiraceae bacterium]